MFCLIIIIILWNGSVSASKNEELIDKDINSVILNKYLIKTFLDYTEQGVTHTYLRIINIRFFQN